MLTLSPSAGLWDACEFVCCGARLDVGHPPGAPLYWLLLRLFVVLFPQGCEALACNVVSALCCAAASMLLSLIARELLLMFRPSLSRLPLLVGQTVAGLSWAWCCSVWDVAVETEVYGGAALMAFVILHLSLLWRRCRRPHYLALALFVVGLSAGVHWLSWLLLPVAVAAVCSVRGRRWLVGGFVGGLLAVPFLVALGSGLYFDAGMLLDIFCVNICGLPVGVGLFIGVLMPPLLFLALRLSARRRWVRLSAGTFFLISVGFVVLLLPFVRASSQVAVAVAQPSDAQRFADYLSRRQYGARPLLYGPSYSSRPSDIDISVAMDYDAAKHRYMPLQRIEGYLYPDSQKVMLPRMTLPDEASLFAYRSWAHPQGWPDSLPSLADNIIFMFRYQMGHMMMRYLMWNFCGRQNDRIGDGGFTSGNVICGIAHIDDIQLHEGYGEIRDDGRFALYGLPLLAAFVGLMLLWRKGGRRVLLLIIIWMLLCGPALAFYVNMPPFEPRERDYIYILFFAAFCIAAAVAMALAMKRLMLSRRVRQCVALRHIAAFVIALALPLQMLCAGWHIHDRSGDTLVEALAMGILNAAPRDGIIIVGGDNDTYPLWYAQEVLGHRRDVRVVNIGLLPLPWYVDQLLKTIPHSAPLSMAMADDARHDRLGMLCVTADAADTLSLTDAVAVSSSLLGISRLLPSSMLRLPLADTVVTVSLRSEALNVSEQLLLDIIGSNPHRKVCFMPGVVPQGLGLEPFLWSCGPLSYLEADTSSSVSGRHAMLYHAFLSMPAADIYRPTTDAHNHLHRLRLRHLFSEAAREAAADAQSDAARRILFFSLSRIPTDIDAADPELLIHAQMLQNIGLPSLARQVMIDVASYCSAQIRRAARLHPYAPSAAQTIVDNVGQQTSDVISLLRGTGNDDVATVLEDLLMSLGVEG